MHRPRVGGQSHLLRGRSVDNLLGPSNRLPVKKEEDGPINRECNTDA